VGSDTLAQEKEHSRDYPRLILAIVASCAAAYAFALAAIAPSARASTTVLSQNWEHGLRSEVPSPSENDPLTGKPNQWLVFSGGFPFVGGDEEHSEPGQGTQDTQEVGSDGVPGWPTNVSFFGDGGVETSDTSASDRHNLWHVQSEPQNVSINPFITSNLISLPAGDSAALPAAPDGGNNVAWFGSATSGTFCGTLQEVQENPSNAEGSDNGCETKVDPEEKPAGGVGFGETDEEGELVSPPFDLAGAKSAVLRFNSWFEVEAVAAQAFDVMEIDYTTDAGTSQDPFKWIKAGTLNPAEDTNGQSFQDYTDEGQNTPGTWQPILVDLSNAIGSKHVRVRFVFDTWDVLFNGFRGWLVDNVSVQTPDEVAAPQITGVGVCTSTAPQVTVIHGANFFAGSTVRVDDEEPEAAQTPSSSRIEIPALSPGSHSLQVINPNGLESKVFEFTQPSSCEVAHISLSVSASSNQVGTAAAITASVTAEGGAPIGGVPVTFTVTGANPQTATVTTDEAGEATFTYTGANAGSDHIVASFAGSEGTTTESSEVAETWTASSSSGGGSTGGSSTGSSTTGGAASTGGGGTGGVLPSKEVELPPPVLGKTVNAQLVSGEVFVKLPGGAQESLAGPWDAAFEALSKGLGFVPLVEARQIPVGSILETTHGVVKLTTATAAAGKFGFGDFGAGIFKLLQNRKQRGLTELDIMDSRSPRQVCATVGKRASVASRHLSSSVLGRLNSSDHGKFTARGQYSAATVRGTVYSVTNECAGTLTAVSRGEVSVRDFVRRKTITLFAGQHYLAKAP
jgi:hypothetical protein